MYICLYSMAKHLKNMKPQRNHRKLILSKNKDYDPQIGLIRFLLVITVLIMGMAVYTLFR